MLQALFDKAIPLFHRAARDPQRTNRARAKLSLSLAQKGLFDLAHETLAGIHVEPDSEETAQLLALLDRTGGEFEGERLLEKAGSIYKTICLVDAGYRDVVMKVEKFS